MEILEIKTLVKKKIIEILSENMLENEDKIEIEDDDALIENGLIDSLDIIPLVEYCNLTFNIDILSEDLSIEHWNSVNSISKFIAETLNHGPSDTI